MSTLVYYHFYKLLLNFISISFIILLLLLFYFIMILKSYHKMFEKIFKEIRQKLPKTDNLIEIARTN